MTIFRRLLNASDVATAWRLVLLSWIVVLILIFPALTLTWKMNNLDAVV